MEMSMMMSLFGKITESCLQTVEDLIGNARKARATGKPADSVDPVTNVRNETVETTSVAGTAAKATVPPPITKVKGKKARVAKATQEQPVEANVAENTATPAETARTNPARKLKVWERPLFRGIDQIVDWGRKSPSERSRDKAIASTISISCAFQARCRYKLVHDQVINWAVLTYYQNPHLLRNVFTRKVVDWSMWTGNKISLEGLLDEFDKENFIGLTRDQVKDLYDLLLQMKKKDRNMSSKSSSQSWASDDDGNVNHHTALPPELGGPAIASDQDNCSGSSRKRRKIENQKGHQISGDRSYKDVVARSQNLQKKALTTDPIRQKYRKSGGEKPDPTPSREATRTKSGANRQLRKRKVSHKTKPRPGAGGKKVQKNQLAKSTQKSNSNGPKQGPASDAQLSTSDSASATGIPPPSKEVKQS